MPQKKAAFKALKVSKKKYTRNQAVINEVKTLTKKLNDLVAAKEKEKAKKILVLLVKKLNTAKSKGIIHRTAASRKISRAMSRTAALR